MNRRAILLGAGAAATLPSLVFAQNLVKLRVGAATNDSYAEPYFGAAQGFFAKQGIELDIQVFFNAQASVQAVVANVIDLALADMIQVVNPIEHGVPLAYFAGGGLYSTEHPATLLCVAKNSDIRSAKDLEGKTIAVISLTSVSSVAVQDWIVQSGADLSKIKLYEMAFAVMVPALVRGTVAAAFLAEPFISESKNDIRVLASPFDSIAKHFYLGAWFSYRSWLNTQRPLVRRFVDAVYQTAQWANAHHNETAVMLSQIGKIELANVRNMARTVWAGSLDPKLMQPVIDIAVKHNLIEQPVDANDIIFRV